MKIQTQILLFMLLLFSCSINTEQVMEAPDINESSANTEVKELLGRFDVALNAMDIEAIMGFYDEDITIFPPAETPVIGKDEVQEWTKVIIDRFLLVEHHHPQQSMDYGDIVLHWGNATGSLTSRQSGEEIPFDNKYIHIFRRDSVGVLKLVWGMFNANPSEE